MSQSKEEWREKTFFKEDICKIKNQREPISRLYIRFLLFAKDCI